MAKNADILAKGTLNLTHSEAVILILKSMNTRRIISIIAAVLLWDVTVLAQGPNSAHEAQLNDPVAVVPKSGLVPENLALISSGDVSPKHIFIADKENRTLTVWTHEKEKPILVGAFPMDIGKLQGDKISEGDHRTPEGIYFFQERKEGPGLDFSLYGKRAFTLDYPNYFDHRVSKTGSGIWLHAVPDTTSLLRGSRGCVVVRNNIIEQLTPYIKLKSTPLLILDKVNYVPDDKITTARKELQDWVQSWKTAWESKDLEKYLTFYSADFKAQKMDKKKWRQYKSGLNERYQTISINVKDPFLLMKKNEAIISFIQDYKSDGLKDLGEKTLYVQKNEQGKFEILTEIWRPLSSDALVLNPTAAASSSVSKKE